jgi:hypothetical protein
MSPSFRSWFDRLTTNGGGESRSWFDRLTTNGILWVVILMVLAGLGGGDLLARAPWMVWGGLGFGAAGLVATAWFHRWSRRPERAALGRRLDDSLGGGSLRRAQAELAELLRFEKDA